jgi:hypothetical protein
MLLQRLGDDFCSAEKKLSAESFWRKTAVIRLWLGAPWSDAGDIIEWKQLLDEMHLSEAFWLDRKALLDRKGSNQIFSHFLRSAENGAIF